MSRLTQYPAVGAISLFQTIDPITPTASNYNSQAKTFIGYSFFHNSAFRNVLVEL